MEKPFRVKDFYLMLLHPLGYFFVLYGVWGITTVLPFILLWTQPPQSLSMFLITNLLILMPALILLSIGITQIYRIKLDGGKR